MAIPLTGTNVPAGGAAFATDNATLGGGRIQFVKILWAPDGTPTFVDDATGLRLPVKAVLSDVSDAEVKPGDSALNAIRTTIVGDASVQELHLDDAPYAVAVDTGVPQHYFVDETGASAGASQGGAGIARMSKYRLQYVTAPPRNSSVQNNVTLTTTAEITLLSAGLTNESNDLAFIGVYTDDTTVPTNVCRKVLFRDSPGGATRFTIPLSEKGGSNVDFGSVRWKQTGTAQAWTVALSTSTPVIGGFQSSVFVHVSAERRLT